MNPVLNHSVALLFLWIILDARAEPSSLPSVKPSPVSSSETLADAAQLAPKLNGERVPGQTFQSMPQAQLARDIEAAYTKAHSAPAEEVTTGLDGTDKVFRIRTPLGANLCLNWRDVDRFNAGKGKSVFVLACNR